MADDHEPLDLAWDPDEEPPATSKPAPEAPGQDDETFGLAEDSGEHESIGLAYDPDVDQGQAPKPVRQPQPKAPNSPTPAASAPPPSSSGTPFSGEEPPAVEPEEAARRREEQRRRAAEEVDRGDAIKGKLKLLLIALVVGGFLLLWVIGLLRNWLG